MRELSFALFAAGAALLAAVLVLLRLATFSPMLRFGIALAAATFAAAWLARRLDRKLAAPIARRIDELERSVRARDAALADLRTGIEAEVDARTRDLLARNEQLQTSMEEARAAAVTKAQFLANMSHEIRTPMNGILGMNELLLDSPLNEQQRSYAEIVKSSAESLLEIINDILDFSKIEAGKLRLEEIEFDLHRTVEEVIGLLSGSARKKRLDLFCWIAPAVARSVRGDPTRLRQVLTNLIGNAIKFTGHGKVSVRLELLDDHSGSMRVRFAIEDTGIGIAADRRKRLFLPFSQVDATTTRKYGGTGLGLAISKQLVELMGGEIGVESELGIVSTFLFSVLFEKVRSGSIREFVLPDGVVRPRILVAETSTAVREMLHQQLLAWDFEHELVGDAARALAALRRALANEEPFGLVLLDGELASSEASELTELLRDEHSARLKLILLEWNAAQDVPLGFAPEVRLHKPIRPSQLFDAIVAVVGDDSFLDLPHGTAAPHHEAGENALAPRIRVLLVEDNQINQVVASKILAKGGFRCEVVADGRAAIERVTQGGWDVVLMDCQMPEFDGFEATRRIREHEKKAEVEGRVHIIALTANAMKGDRERCLEAGMDDYVSKPVKPELLLGKLRGFCAADRERLEKKYAGVEVEPRHAEDHPFDVEHLLQRYAGRYGDLRAAIHELDRRSIDCLGRLRFCLGNRSAAEARVLAEDLREALALFSSERLHALAVRLEELSSGKRFGEALGCFEDLQRELARCRAWLPELMARAQYS